MPSLDTLTGDTHCWDSIVVSTLEGTPIEDPPQRGHPKGEHPLMTPKGDDPKGGHPLMESDRRLIAGKTPAKGAKARSQRGTPTDVEPKGDTH